MRGISLGTSVSPDKYETARKESDPERLQLIAPFRVLKPASGAVCELERRAHEVLRLCEAVRVVRRTRLEKNSDEVRSLQPDCRPDTAGDTLDLDRTAEDILCQVERRPDIRALARDEAHTITPDVAWDEYLFVAGPPPSPPSSAQESVHALAGETFKWFSPEHANAVNELFALVDSMSSILVTLPGPLRSFNEYYRFTSDEGAEGSSPLHQCILRKTPASLLAARFIVYRFPDLVLDAYGKGIYMGEHLLHLCIVTKERGFILFVERHVRGGFRMLQRLGSMPHHSTANFLSLHGVEHALSDIRAYTQEQRAGNKDGQFFDIGSSCYYGGYALSFAASTGASLWWFMYLVNRLRVGVNVRDKERKNTALHMAVIWSNNESYRYLKALGADEDAKNEDGLTPLQLAAQLGLKCTQAPVTSKDIFEVPPNAKESRESHSMFCFILEQSSSVLWSFGNVVSTKFEVQQIHGPRWSSEGTSCLKLVCDAQQLDLLCPSEDSRFYASMQSGGKNIYVQADEEINEVFRMPIKPGVESPPVSSMVLLIIAEYCWVTFGRRLLLLEFAFYCCFLGLLTFATVDRSARYPPIRTKTQGFFVDAFLMASSVLLAVFQWFKTRLVQDVVRGRIWQLSTTEVFFVILLYAACGCTIAACAIRFEARENMRMAAHPRPFDGELLSIATLAAYSYLLYYLRCFNGIGPLSITVIQMLIRDVSRMLIIYGCFLVGFAIAFHSVIFSDGWCLDQVDQQCPNSDLATVGEPFITVGRSLLATALMLMTQFPMQPFHEARATGVGITFVCLYIIVGNILLLNLLIALLNKTFSDIYGQVVLQLERLAKLFPPLARYVEAQYGRWLCEVVEETEGEGGARTVVVKRTLNVERVAFDQVTETKQEVLGTSKVDDDARVFRRADELVPAEELLQRERLAFGEGGKRGGVSEEQLAVRQRIQSHPSLGGVGRTDKLLVIDMQHSFIKGAEPPRGLQVCGAEEIVMPCNELIRHFAMRGATVAFTQDYHPPDHSSFVTVWKKQEASAGNADAAEKLEPFDVVARSYGQQKLWPPHCVQGTPGCKFAEGLHIPADAIIVQKGHREQVDSYSAFFDADRVSRTGLLEALEEDRQPSLTSTGGEPPPHGTETLYIIGLSFDECVRFTAEDAAVLARLSASDAETDPVSRARTGAFARSGSMPPRCDQQGDGSGPINGNGNGNGNGAGPEEEAESKQDSELANRWRHVAVVEDATRLIWEDRRAEIRRTLQAMGVKIVGHGTLMPKVAAEASPTGVKRPAALSAAALPGGPAVGHHMSPAASAVEAGHVVHNPAFEA